MCYCVGIATKEEPMNTREIIKEIRKAGKVGINMSGTELEILVDKTDLIEMLKTDESLWDNYKIYPRAGLGYRCVYKVD